MTSPFAPATEWCGRGAVGWDGTVGPDDLRLLSASSVPKVLAAPNLERWAITTTVERIAENLDRFAAMVAVDITAAVQWADQLRYAPEPGAELNAADSGTLMHTLLECWLKGEAVSDRDRATVERDPVLTALATNLWAWYQRFKPTAVAMEQVVYNPASGLAGRFDAIVRFGNSHAAERFGTCLIDLKNKRQARTAGGAKHKVYGDGHAMQLQSYRGAPLVATFEPRIQRTGRATSNRVYLLNTAEREACAPMWDVDSTAIVLNTPEVCALYPIETGAGVQRRVDEAVGLSRWLHEESRDVVGPPFIPPIDLPHLTAPGAPA